MPRGNARRLAGWLTRSRLGTVIWVPKGDAEDETRAIRELNAIAEFLKTAGARALEAI
jgi:hypothetical protein